METPSATHTPEAPKAPPAPPAPQAPAPRLRERLHAGRGPVHDAGMATAEYAVATLAAVGFAGLLFAVLRSGEVQQMLTELVRSALGSP